MRRRAARSASFGSRSPAASSPRMIMALISSIARWVTLMPALPVSVYVRRAVSPKICSRVARRSTSASAAATHRVVGRGQRAHRPVGAEHHAVGPEGVEHGLGVGPQVVHGPGLPVRLGDHARELADDVLVRRQRAHVRRPRLQLAARDRRLGEVVDDEHELVERAHGLDRRRQLRREREQVVDEPGVGDRAQPGAHVVAAEPARIGLALHLVADADEPLARPAPAQRVGHVRRPSDRPSRRRRRSARARRREREQVGCLLGHGDRLHEHGRVDARGRATVARSSTRERAAQRRQRGAVDPGLVAHREIPQVVVCVERANIQWFASSILA